MTYSFKPSGDFQHIKSVLLAPNNLPYAFDDLTDPTTFEPAFHDQILNLQVQEDGETLGYFFLFRKDEVTAECHMAFLPRAYGKVAEIGQAALKWVWANLPVTILNAPCLESNKLALRAIRSMGFKDFSILSSHWLKDGERHDFILLRATKDHNNSEV